MMKKQLFLIKQFQAVSKIKVTPGLKRDISFMKKLRQSYFIEFIQYGQNNTHYPTLPL